MTEESRAEEYLRAGSFDQVAETYDRYRPGYPQALVEHVLNTSQIPPKGKILEIGCGTGKATQPFAQRGYTIHCLDTGQNLIAVARRILAAYHQVTFEITDFNTWQGPQNFYDLLISAQAWHWIDPNVGYAKAANVLKPGGWLALFWNMSIVPDTPISNAIQKVYAEIFPNPKGGVGYNEEAIAKTKAEIEASGYFQDISIWRYPWSQRYNETDYLGLLDTFSDHILLPPATRRHLYKGIAAAIRTHGGYVERPVVAVVFMGKKR